MKAFFLQCAATVLEYPARQMYIARIILRYDLEWVFAPVIRSSQIVSK